MGKKIKKFPLSLSPPHLSLSLGASLLPAALSVIRPKLPTVKSILSSDFVLLSLSPSIEKIDSNCHRQSLSFRLPTPSTSTAALSRGLLLATSKCFESTIHGRLLMSPPPGSQPPSATHSPQLPNLPRVTRSGIAGTHRLSPPSSRSSLPSDLSRSLSLSISSDPIDPPPRPHSRCRSSPPSFTAGISVSPSIRISQIRHLHRCFFSSSSAIRLLNRLQPTTSPEFTAGCSHDRQSHRLPFARSKSPLPDLPCCSLSYSVLVCLLPLALSNLSTQISLSFLHRSHSLSLSALTLRRWKPAATTACRLPIYPPSPPTDLGKKYLKIELQKTIGVIVWQGGQGASLGCGGDFDEEGFHGGELRPDDGECGGKEAWRVLPGEDDEFWQIFF